MSVLANLETTAAQKKFLDEPLNIYTYVNIFMFFFFTLWY